MNAMITKSESRAWLLLMLATSTSACNGDSHRGRGPRPDEIPSFEAVAGGKVVVGLQLSPVRAERTITGFRVTKNPISVRRYKQCVSAGACDAPALVSAECRVPGDPKHLNGPTFEAANGDDLPVTCVKPEQAIAYCRWLGGKLPDSTQWLAAARGPAVRRYAWGNELNACEQHPEARLRGRLCDVSTPERLRIGTHVAGASPSGIEDVLLTPAELVATSHDAFFSVCGDGGSACLVRGLSPGAIDGFGPVPSAPAAPAAPAEQAPRSIQTYGFRCVLEDK